MLGTGVEAKGALAEVCGAEDFGFEDRIGMAGAGEVEAFAGLDLAAGADEGSPDDFAGVPGAEVFGEEDFDAAGGAGRVALGMETGAGGEETRRENAGVIEDEEVAGAEAVGEVGEDVIGIGAGCAVHDEHAAGASDGGRGLRDEVFGEVEVEVSDAHSN